MKKFPTLRQLQNYENSNTIKEKLSSKYTVTEINAINKNLKTLYKQILNQVWTLSELDLIHLSDDGIADVASHILSLPETRIQKFINNPVEEFTSPKSRKYYVDLKTDHMLSFEGYLLYSMNNLLEDLPKKRK